MKLDEILSELIDQGGYRRNRGKICDSVGISPAALSQYVSGRTKPSFDVLLRLADFFEVSVDYLVYGQQVRAIAAPDYGPLVKYVDISLSRIQQRAQQHSSIVTRVGRILSEQIDDAVRDVVDGSLGTSAGLLPDDDTLTLETYSDETQLITMNLGYDIITMPDSDEEAAGRFLPIVAQNINNQRTYKFLLPSRLGVDWKELVVRMRKLLSYQCSQEAITQYCLFRATDTPIFAGLGICRLDLETLKMQQPAFLETISEFIDASGWISYTIPTSEHLTADALHDVRHRENARKQFDYLWKNSVAL
ncbi:helix-turn-helix domain-containing protein [Amycolatopsis japonica]|uniref:helix-turn-helix domain-containing protein n=1 Tax=Amycolatopsis japonica TaxID=208439 RepID=UPI003790CEB2